MRAFIVYAYITLKEGYKDKVREIDLKELVKNKIAKFAEPDFIQFTSSLPKTRSDKILRRILKKVAAGNYDDLGDISTLANPEVVDTIVRNHRKLTEKNIDY